MSDDQLADFETSLIGRSCVVTRREHDWAFDLSDGFGLAVSAPWRIVSNNRIAFASEDDRQMFGLTSPVDGEIEARRLLGGKTITATMLDRQTADLTLQFDTTTPIDVFNNSAGYEGWEATYIIEDERRSLIALGGGEVALFGSASRGDKNS
jgi:hypothetical protein